MQGLLFGGVVGGRVVGDAFFIQLLYKLPTKRRRVTHLQAASITQMRVTTVRFPAHQGLSVVRREHLGGETGVFLEAGAAEGVIVHHHSEARQRRRLLMTLLSSALIVTFATLCAQCRLEIHGEV